MQPPEVRGKLVLYCFRGGRTTWVKPRARGRTGVLNKASWLCNFSKDLMSTKGVVVAKKRWGGRGATARRNRIVKACRVQISAEDVAVAKLRWCDEEANEGGENSACAAHQEKKIVPYRAYGAHPCLEHPVRTKRDSTKSAPISRQQGPQAVCEWQQRRGKCSNRLRRMNAHMHAERTACGEWQKQWSLRHKAGTDRSIGKHSR
jgi:hypothetical protein